ncbi:hypothetical protein PFISCL1PPCAC_1820 [Pristionchus fissidentatus]|uniref:Ribosomal protein n=1 Tax=Pristionchus fissidentatus TaxID=1538716 RepID=A0AAV5UWC4_9BILA|nr:hypothetical protein PFISCL1PPCAC_1820 [Pristionchus fissidentatus]
MGRLVGDESVDETVEIIEERDEIEGQLHPRDLHATVQLKPIQNCGGIVDAGARHDRSLRVCVSVEENERNIGDRRDDLHGDNEEDGHDGMQDVLGKDEDVETPALLDRVLVVRLELIDADHGVNGEEDAEGSYDECHQVAERHECERHLLGNHER